MLESRSIDLEESLIHEKVASRPPELRLTDKKCPQLIIHRHIEIAFAISLIIITDTMPLLWERADRLREKCKFRDKKCEFSFVCIEELSLHTDEVTKIDELLGEFISGHNGS
jgi:hypothetical protein